MNSTSNTYRLLAKYTLPTIAMMVFTSAYSIADGFFVSNYVGKTEFAAINLVFPVLLILGAFGFMFGAGGSAIVAKMLGRNAPLRANQYFSMIVYTTILFSLFLTLCGLFAIEPILNRFDVGDEMKRCSLLYGKVLILSLPAFILQNLFQILLITAGKPNFGLKITLLAGCTNIILDYVFIAVLGFGLAGAAYATAISQILGGATPLIYFIKGTFPLRLTKTRIHPKVIFKASVNGSSEMLTSISMSVISMLYMWQLLKYGGEDGIAAYGAIMYLEFIFSGIFLGFATGSAPIVSFYYGARNTEKLKSIFLKSVLIISVLGFSLTGLAELFSSPLSGIFVGYDATLHDFTIHGFRIYASAFLLMGFNIYASAFYTALNNGVVSAVIAFSRTFLFQFILIILLPLFWGLNGVWSTIAVSEALTLLLSLAFLFATKKKYGYQ